MKISDTFQTLYDAEVLTRWKDKARLEGKTKEKEAYESNKVQFRLQGYGIATPHTPGVNVSPMGTSITTSELTLTDWDAFDYVDKLEAEKNNINDIAELADIAAVALGTRSDQIKIDALKKSGATVIGDSNKELTVDTLAKAQSILNMNGCPDEDRVFVYHPTALASLMKDNKFISNEFLVGKQQLTDVRNGQGSVALGFDFVRIAPRPSTDPANPFGLPFAGATSTDGLLCFVFHKNAIGYGYNSSIKTSIDWVAEKRAWLVGGQLSAGACVLNKDWIVAIKIKA